MSKVKAEMIDFAYLCPHNGCQLGYANPNSLRRHCERVHEMKITIHEKKIISDEERRLRQARYSRKYRMKKQLEKRPRRQIKKKMYNNLDTEDADERGVYGCERPLLEYKQSLIEGAGNGIFALDQFNAGDIVTWFACETNDNNKCKAYSLKLNDGRIFSSIKIPEVGKGMASFINREERTMARSRKNCNIIECPNEKNKLYIEVTKKIKVGEELYTTYSRGYRIKK